MMDVASARQSLCLQQQLPLNSALTMTSQGLAQARLAEKLGFDNRPQHQHLQSLHGQQPIPSEQRHYQPVELDETLRVDAVRGDNFLAGVPAQSQLLQGGTGTKGAISDLCSAPRHGLTATDLAVAAGKENEEAFGVAGGGALTQQYLRHLQQTQQHVDCISSVAQFRQQQQQGHQQQQHWLSVSSDASTCTSSDILSEGQFRSGHSSRRVSPGASLGSNDFRAAAAAAALLAAAASGGGSAAGRDNLSQWSAADIACCGSGGMGSSAEVGSSMAHQQQQQTQSRGGSCDWGGGPSSLARAASSSLASLQTRQGGGRGDEQLLGMGAEEGTATTRDLAENVDIGHSLYHALSGAESSCSQAAAPKHQRQLQPEVSIATAPPPASTSAPTLQDCSDLLISAAEIAASASDSNFLEYHQSSFYSLQDARRLEESRNKMGARAAGGCSLGSGVAAFRQSNQTQPQQQQQRQQLQHHNGPSDSSSRFVALQKSVATSFYGSSAFGNEGAGGGTGGMVMNNRERRSSVTSGTGGAGESLVPVLSSLSDCCGFPSSNASSSILQTTTSCGLSDSSGVGELGSPSTSTVSPASYALSSRPDETTLNSGCDPSSSLRGSAFSCREAVFQTVSGGMTPSSSSNGCCGSSGGRVVVRPSASTVGECDRESPKRGAWVVGGGASSCGGQQRSSSECGNNCAGGSCCCCSLTVKNLTRQFGGSVEVTGALKQQLQQQRGGRGDGSFPLGEKTRCADSAACGAPPPQLPHQTVPAFSASLPELGDFSSVMAGDRYCALSLPTSTLEAAANAAVAAIASLTPPGSKTNSSGSTSSTATFATLATSSRASSLCSTSSIAAGAAAAALASSFAGHPLPLEAYAAVLAGQQQQSTTGASTATLGGVPPAQGVPGVSSSMPMAVAAATTSDKASSTTPLSGAVVQRLSQQHQQSSSRAEEMSQIGVGGVSLHSGESADACWEDAELLKVDTFLGHPQQPQHNVQRHVQRLMSGTDGSAFGRGGAAAAHFSGHAGADAAAGAGWDVSERSRTIRLSTEVPTEMSAEGGVRTSGFAEERCSSSTQQHLQLEGGCWSSREIGSEDPSSSSDWDDSLENVPMAVVAPLPVVERKLQQMTSFVSGAVDKLRSDESSADAAAGPLAETRVSRCGPLSSVEGGCGGGSGVGRSFSASSGSSTTACCSGYSSRCSRLTASASTSASTTASTAASTSLSAARQSLPRTSSVGAQFQRQDSSTSFSSVSTTDSASSLTGPFAGGNSNSCATAVGVSSLTKAGGCCVSVPEEQDQLRQQHVAAAAAVSGNRGESCSSSISSSNSSGSSRTSNCSGSTGTRVSSSSVRRTGCSPGTLSSVIECPAGGACAEPTEPSFIVSLATVLSHLIYRSPPDPRRITIFHCACPPTITIRSYIGRLAKYFCCSNECFVLALIYIDRILRFHSAFVVNSLNIYHLLVTALMLSAKFFDDTYYSNTYYAKVGGLPLRLLNRFEVEFMKLLDFQLYVAPEEYDHYRSRVLDAVGYHSNGSNNGKPVVAAEGGSMVSAAAVGLAAPGTSQAVSAVMSAAATEC